MPRITTLSLLLSAAFAFAGCAVGPDYQSPSVALPGTWRNAAAAQARAASVAPDLAAWWRGFGDAGLDRVIAQVVARNLDLAQAGARIARSRAEARSLSAALLPRGEVLTSATRVRQSLLDPSARIARGAPAFQRDFTQDDVGVAASWELDLFGGRLREREAARADVDAAIADGDAMRVSLAAEAADAYLQLRGEQQRLALAREQERIDEQLVGLVGQRVQEGLSAERELHQAQAALEGVHASMPPLLAAIEVQLQRLRVLAGDLPDDAHDALAAAAPLPAAPALPAGAQPSELLRRRPDIVAAERRLAAANARIGAALSEYYPKVSLAALLGVSSIESGRLFSDDAVQHQLGLGLRWRLFDFGRVDAEVAAARGRDAEALAAYRATALRASAEVETALSDLVQQEARASALTRQIGQLRQAREQSQQAYDGGAISLIEVLDADRQLLAASDQLSSAQAGAGRAAVACFRAMGGGWSPATLASR